MKAKKNIFIDAGSNKGQSFDHFSLSYPLSKFDYYLIEPNEKCMRKLNGKASGKNVTVVNKALYTLDGSRPLYGKHSKDLAEMAQGLSLITDHNTGLYRAERVGKEVKCIDVSSLLKDLSKKYENIYIKLDIESSEYAVLEKIIKDKVYTKIKKIWVEWHDGYMTQELRKGYQKRQADITDFLTKKGIKIKDWH